MTVPVALDAASDGVRSGALDGDLVTLDGVPAELARALEAERVAREAARALLTAAAAQALSESALLAVQHETVAARRDWDLIVATAAAEVGRRSAPELGRTGLARRNGHTTPERFLAGITGGSRRDARDLIKTGSTLGSVELHQEQVRQAEAAGLPEPEPEEPVYPVVAAALGSGGLSAGAASMFTHMLDSVRGDATPEQIRVAERQIVGKAAQLDLEKLSPIVRRYHLTLQATAAERQQERLHQERVLIITERRDGAVVLSGVFDPVSAAPLRTVLDSMVKAAFRARREGNSVVEDRRSAGQIRADALVTLSRHMLGCDQAPISHVTTKIAVRVDLEALKSGVGFAELEGGGVMPVGELRGLAVDAEYLPTVLGGASEALDVGRARRRFTQAQREALVERDGGCASCYAPPSYSDGHHIVFWGQGGRTDLSNGALLCVACHHTLHHEGWEVRATATSVWFRARGPDGAPGAWRLGGRARFGITAEERKEIERAGPSDYPP
ncbi:DUF222 domain-containing protein [Demequina sp.]|uniref:HNH endonuclease n=1 Tax=Demequina sp. TaxID=2050685 RepID=UPI003A852D90